MMNTTCPICAAASQPAFEKYGHMIRECDHCGHRFVAIEPVAEHAVQQYSDSYFTGDWAGYPDYLAEADILTAHGRYYGHLLQRFMKPGKVLDVGAAAGFILKGLTQCGWCGTGLEPNPAMVAFARQELGLQAVVGTLEDYQGDDCYDLISMVQVVAHFYDVRAALEQSARLTRPGGYLLIETWNKDSSVARFMGQNWHEYSPPTVLHWFTPQSMRALLAQFGFHQIAQARPHKWLKGAHAKSLGTTTFKDSPLRHILKLIPDELIIPYPNLDLFWGLYQKDEEYNSFPLVSHGW